MIPSEKKGELYLILHTFFESWFPIVSIITISLLGAVFSYAFSVIFALIFFTIMMVFNGHSSELLKSDSYLDLFLSSVLIMLVFLLIFIGLQYTTSGNAAAIIFMQLFFSYIYFNLLGKQLLNLRQSVGALMMAIGAIAILFQKSNAINYGDIYVLLAAAIAPIANLYQKRARLLLSSDTLLCVRSFISLPVLVIMAFYLEPVPSIQDIKSVLILLIINGSILLGISKLLWIEALHRLSITKASALIALTPLFTMIYGYFLLHEKPTYLSIAGAFFIILGTIFITQFSQDPNLKKLRL